MKILKKAGAVLLALAMIAVMIPQLGSKVVKAAAGTSYVYNAQTKNGYFTEAGTQTWQKGGETADFSAEASGLKCGSTMDKTKPGGIKFTVTSGKYAIVEVNMNRKKELETCYLVVENATNSERLAESLTNQYPELQISPTKLANSAVNSEYFMSAAVYPAGDYIVCRDKNQTAKEVWLYQIKVTEYDSSEEAQAVLDTYVNSITQKPKCTVSGKITSEVDLTNGTVSLTTTTEGAKNVTSEPITKNEDGTYNYVANDVIGNAVYNVTVTSQALTEAKKTVKSAELAKTSFTLTNTNKTDADFTVSYKDITNIWDFSTIADWSACGYENLKEVVTYKGLLVDVTSGGKFATGTDNNTGVGRIQTNTGAKIKIPVSGWGTVTCTFDGNVADTTTLGGVKGNSTKTITANYENAEYVELSIGAKNIYIKKIEVTPDATPAVKQLGTSIRVNTADWGNGIRFGGQLDLTKVNKDTCESGTLIGLASTVGDGNEMTIDDVGTTCINVKRTTYITETETALEYAAALINIPDTALDTLIVARPYVKVGGNTYYGDQIATTYNNATQAVNQQ